MSDFLFPTGPSPEQTPEPIVPETIEELLRRLPADEQAQQRAFALLQRYRGNALAAVGRCTSQGERRFAVEAARTALQERLLALLAECDSPGRDDRPRRTAHPARRPHHLRLDREYRTEDERQVEGAEHRFHTTYLSLLSHETWVHTLEGMSPSAADAAGRARDFAFVR